MPFQRGVLGSLLMTEDFSNNVADLLRATGAGAGAPPLFPENQALCEALEQLERLAQDGNSERAQDYTRQFEEELVSHAKFLLPIDVWKEDVATLPDGTLLLKDGASYEKGTTLALRMVGPSNTLLALFTGWGELYRCPYPGHVHALVVTFEDCLHLIEEEGGGMGLAINPGRQRGFTYSADELQPLVKLRDQMVAAGRADRSWDYGVRTYQYPKVVLRGPQDRVRLYLPEGLGALEREKQLAVTNGVCPCTVPLPATTRQLLSELLVTLSRLRPDLVQDNGAWEAYAWDGSDAGQLIGRITYADTRKGSYRLEYLDDASPSASFIYCEFLGKSLRAFVGESSHDRLTSGFTKHLQDMLRACALDNTRFRGRSYTYSGEEVAREYTDKLANPQAQPVGRTLLATLPMMVLGALLMYVLRVGLWPGVLAVVGSIALLLVLPIAAGTLVLSGINKAEATRTVRAALDAGRLPSAGQHNARFSVRQDCTLYCDEARELRGDRSYEVTVTGHYLLYHMHDGVLAPIPKSAL